jgi:hypothetical protein
MNERGRRPGRLPLGGESGPLGPIYAIMAIVATVDGTGETCSPRRTRDLLEAHRWLRAAGEGASLTVRELGRDGWRRLGPALCVPQPWQHDERTAAAWIKDDLRPAPRGRGRVRAAVSLLRRGLDGAAAASLLRHHEGYFPSLAVAVARTLYTRVGGLYLLRRLDLRAVTADLISGAAIWILPDSDGGRWPAGVHLFTCQGALGDGPEHTWPAGSKPGAGDRSSPSRST